jgi:hypothetical protein
MFSGVFDVCEIMKVRSDDTIGAGHRAVCTGDSRENSLAISRSSAIQAPTANVVIEINDHTADLKIQRIPAVSSRPESIKRDGTQRLGDSLCFSPAL